MTTTRSFFRGSSVAAPSVFTTFGEAGLFFLAEAKKVCGKFFSDAENHVLSEIDILRQEVEALRAQVVSMVSDLVTTMKALEESHADDVTASVQAVAAHDEHIR